MRRQVEAHCVDVIRLEQSIRSLSGRVDRVESGCASTIVGPSAVAGPYGVAPPTPSQLVVASFMESAVVEIHGWGCKTPNAIVQKEWDAMVAK